MNTQIRSSMDRIAEEARGRYKNIITGARKGTESAAGLVKKGKRPVKALSKFGLKMTRLTHKTADGVLKQQTKMVERQLDSFAGSLHAAATASDLKSLVKKQVELAPQSASRWLEDTRSTFGIIAGAGKEVGGIVVGTIDELRGRTAAKTVKTVKKSATSTAKKVKKTTAKSADKAVKKATKVVEEVAAAV